MGKMAGLKIALSIVLVVAMVEAGPTDDDWVADATPESVCKYCGISNPSKPVGRIIDGIDAAPFEYPWVVLIAYNVPKITKNHTACGASVISAKWILTAAHCFYQPAWPGVIIEQKKEDFVFVASAHDLGKLNEEPKGKILPVNRIVINHSYKRKRNVLYGYDIALIELKDKIQQWTKYLRPLCLSKEHSDYAGSPLRYVGWGTTDAKKKQLPDVLQQVEVQGISKKACRKKMMGTVAFDKIKQHHVCTFKKGKDSCQGDSGGPLLVAMKSPGKRYRMAGIVSYGFGCATETPGVNVDPADKVLKEWILEHTKGDPPCFK